MRLFISFFLALITYFLLILFLYFSFFQKSQKKEVLIHTAIIKPVIKNIKKKSIKQKNKSMPKVKKITKKAKKSGSKNNMTKGGKIDFNDIFQNVNENINTEKINLKKQEIISRYKAKNIIKKLNNVKNINVNISFSTSSTLKKEKIDELIKKIGDVWDEISNIPGEYATIKFINNNGNITVYFLDTNLNSDKQKEMIKRLKEIKFDKNIDITVKFQTKVNK